MSSDKYDVINIAGSQVRNPSSHTCSNQGIPNQIIKNTQTLISLFKYFITVRLQLVVLLYFS